MKTLFSMNKKIARTLLKAMDTNTLIHMLIGKTRSMQANKYLDKLAQEYRKLMVIQEPSEAQQKRLEEILNLAIYDRKLNSLLSFVDKQLIKEMDIVEERHSKEVKLIDNQDLFEEIANSEENGSKAITEDNLVVLHLPKISTQRRKRQLIRKPIKILSIVVSLVQISIFVGNCFYEGRITLDKFSLFSTTTILNKHQQSSALPSSGVPNFRYKSARTSRLIQESYSNKTKVEKCSLSRDKLSQDILQYYSSVQTLKKQAEAGTLQPRELQQKAAKLQWEAEKQQREVEKQQREAEKQQREAEKQQQNASARQWQDKAEDSLEKSKLWVCIGEKSLDLVKDYSIISKL